MISSKRLFSIIAFSLLAASTAFAQNDNVYAVKSIAVDGYDVLSYFTQHKAVRGSESFSIEKNGVTYLFSSNENKELFKATPNKYLPAYGGFCSYAMGVDGSKVKIDPETFKVTDGRLYLFYNFGFTNTLTKWNKDERALHSKADENWSKINK